MQERHKNREKYFEEQARSTRKYYIPYLENHLGDLPKKVLEIGCGEGGNLLPFAEKGCDVVGVDMAASRIEQAKLFFQQHHVKGTFIASDIFQITEFKHQFSLIVIHDVIEHIENKKQFLLNLHDFLAPGGVVYFGFPAWQMPFGGHQQIAPNRFISHAPFIHLLPFYSSLLTLFHTDTNVKNELLNIKKTKCPIELFVSLVKQTGYTIIHQQLYFINPHYEVKFGLKPRKLNPWICKIPYVRNFFSTSCFYIIK